MKNTPILLPYQLRNIVEMLDGLLGGDNFSRFMNAPEYDKENFNMWVLGNQKQLFGAGAILYDGLMKEIAALIDAEEIIILPSSVHECILLPMSEDFSLYYLRNMVRDINKTQVTLEDRLSDNIYMYSLKNDEISILTE